jgi:hypothetical protein
MDYLSPAAIADSAFAKAAEVVFEGRRSAHLSTVIEFRALTAMRTAR